MFRSQFPVVLASASPRRKELLKSIFKSFLVEPADVDEEAHTVSNPFETAERLAELKCAALASQRPDSLVIGSDTVVALPQGSAWMQLAKPTDAEDAVTMLSTLSGQTHWVITGLALRWPGGAWAGHDVSRVTFRSLGEAEIRDYVATGEPMDKAGAYAVQAGGGTFIATIEGSRNNVIGLPTELLLAKLSAFALVIEEEPDTSCA